METKVENGKKLEELKQFMTAEANRGDKMIKGDLQKQINKIIEKNLLDQNLIGPKEKFKDLSTWLQHFNEENIADKEEFKEQFKEIRESSSFNLKVLKKEVIDKLETLTKNTNIVKKDTETRF